MEGGMGKIERGRGQEGEKGGGKGRREEGKEEERKGGRDPQLHVV